MKHFLVFICLTGVLFSCATSEGALFETVVEAESSQEDEAEDTEQGSGTITQGTDTTDDASDETDEPEVGIRINASPGSAAIFVNGSLVGTGSVLVSPDSGSYQVTVREDGYYSESVWVSYEADTLVIVDIDLDEITGYLFLDVNPPGAEVTINGYGASEGVTELQIGSYSIRVRLFGYEDWRGSVRIRERQTTDLRVELEEADFRLSDLSVSRKRFSPQNPGKLGSTRISFEVTSWGTGKLVVYDASGAEIYSQPLAGFETWEQQVDWYGRDSMGTVVPDGEYQIGIEAIGRGDAAGTSMWLPVTVDSTARISYRGMLSGLSGALFAPTTDVLPSGSFQIAAGAMGHYDYGLAAGRYPAYFTSRIGLGARSELDLQGGIFINASDTTPYTVGLGYKYQIPTGSGPLVLAASGKVTWVGNTTIDTYGNYTGLGAGFVAGLQTGPLSFSINPEIVISPYTVVYEGPVPAPAFNIWAYGRAAILADFGSLTGALSGSVRTLPFNRAFGIGLPFSAGLEVNWLIPGTQIILSGFAGGEFAAADNFYIMGGGGIGIIN